MSAGLELVTNAHHADLLSARARRVADPFDVRHRIRGRALCVAREGLF